MSAAQRISVPQTTRRVAFGTTANVLADIYQDDINMTMWQRQHAAPVYNECLNWLASTGLRTLQIRLSADTLATPKNVLPELDAFPCLKADVQLLLEMFHSLFAPKAIGLRLTSLSGAMCPKFHVDNVPCRLITTYVGPGSEWLTNEGLDRSKLGAGCGGLSDDRSGLYPNPQSIQTLSSGDVALVKGELWEGNEGAGLVHRSPVIPAGQQRLLMTLDLT
jgi:hypothetical protein